MKKDKKNISEIDISSINDNTILSELCVDILGIVYNIDDITNTYKASINKKDHILKLLKIRDKYQSLEDNATFCYLSDIKLYYIKYLNKYLIRDIVLYKMRASHFFDAFGISEIKHIYKKSEACDIIFTNSFLSKHILKKEYEECFYKRLYGKDWEILNRKRKLKEIMLINE